MVLMNNEVTVLRRFSPRGIRESNRVDFHELFGDIADTVANCFERERQRFVLVE